MRMLDDVYGDDHDRFPLEQEARWRVSRLEWDDEVSDEGEELWYFAEKQKSESALPQQQLPQLQLLPQRRFSAESA